MVNILIYSRPGQDRSMYRIPPFHYLHVLDQTTNVTRLETGPQTFVKKDNEVVMSNTEKMVIVPPRHFCVINNPVMKDENKQVLLDNLGQVNLGIMSIFSIFTLVV